jgi:glycosyltransferase involved in cell wall biosynthesis
MKICMVAYTFYETDNRVRRYAESLAQRGDEVDAIVLRREGNGPVEHMNGVRVLGIQKRQRDERGPLSYLLKLLIFFIRSFWVLTIRHIRRPYDVIHVHSVPDFEVFAAIVPRLMGAKVILDIHDIIPEFYSSKFKVGETSLVFRALLLVERLSTAFSTHVIIANHLWYDRLTKRAVKAEKCTAIINYPDLRIFSRRPRAAKSDDFVMCYPGTINFHQGVDLAVCATELLREKLPNLKFLVIGSGPDREKLRAMIEEKKLQDRVIMAGTMPMEQVAETMASIDLGVVPKRSDSFGNEAFSTKIMEFMAMGVPVLAADTRIDRYYFNEDLVQFFESGNVEDLAEKIFQLATNSERRRTLVKASAEFIELNNWDVKRYEYLDILDRLVRKPAASEGVVARESYRG